MKNIQTLLAIAAAFITLTLLLFTLIKVNKQWEDVVEEKFVNPEQFDTKLLVIWKFAFQQFSRVAWFLLFVFLVVCWGVFANMYYVDLFARELFYGLNRVELSLVVVLFKVLKWDFIKEATYLCFLYVIADLFFESLSFAFNFGYFVPKADQNRKFFVILISSLALTSLLDIVLFVLFFSIFISKSKIETLVRPSIKNEYYEEDPEDDLGASEVETRRTMYGMCYYCWCPCMQEEKNIENTYPHCITTCPDIHCTNWKDCLINGSTWIVCILGLGCYRHGHYFWWCCPIRSSASPETEQEHSLEQLMFNPDIEKTYS